MQFKVLHPALPLALLALACRVKRLRKHLSTPFHPFLDCLPRLASPIHTKPILACHASPRYATLCRFAPCLPSQTLASISLPRNAPPALPIPSEPHRALPCHVTPAALSLTAPCHATPSLATPAAPFLSTRVREQPDLMRFPPFRSHGRLSWCLSF